MSNQESFMAINNATIQAERTSSDGAEPGADSAG